MKYVLCDTNSKEEGGYIITSVSKPLQIFNTREEAVEALGIFSSFYNYNLAVVPENKLLDDIRVTEK